MVTPKYDGPERRSDNITLEVINTMRQWLEDHKEEMLGQTRRIEERLEQLSASTLAVVNEQNKALKEIHAMFQAAFPKGDGAAHCRTHEALERKQEEEKEFWLDIKKKVIGWAGTAIIGWVAVVLWAAFVKGPT